jgi:hypothetical protein
MNSTFLIDFFPPVSVDWIARNLRRQKNELPVTVSGGNEEDFRRYLNYILAEVRKCFVPSSPEAKTCVTYTLDLARKPGSRSLRKIRFFLCTEGKAVNATCFLALGLGLRLEYREGASPTAYLENFSWRRLEDLFRKLIFGQGRHASGKPLPVVLLGQ